MECFAMRFVATVAVGASDAVAVCIDHFKFFYISKWSMLLCPFCEC